jgi:superoxide dismutase, Fe-Mn family
MDDGMTMSISAPAGRSWLAILVYPVWLCGWVAGELSALAALFHVRLAWAGSAPRAMSPAETAFLVGWLCMWTLAGALVLFTPGFTVAGLEAAKLKFTNSMILHELYFANLGGGGGAVGSQTERALVQAYGSLTRWERLFRALGNSLGGGSGWAILAWDFHAHGPRIHWAGDHTNALALGAPLLVMDMYEHAYAMDYGASAKEYIEAFFKNVQWAEVEGRLGRAQKADAALRG